MATVETMVAWLITSKSLSVWRFILLLSKRSIDRFHQDFDLPRDPLENCDFYKITDLLIARPKWISIPVIIDSL
jgi:hypothetical protein